MGRAENLACWHVPGAAARRRFLGLDPHAFAAVVTLGPNLAVEMENHKWD